MSTSEVLYQVHGTAAWITLNRPAARNALSTDVLEHISAVLDRAHDDRAVRSVVLAGRGPMFCAGADLKMASEKLAGEGLTGFLRCAGALFDRIAAFPLPVIAAVHGGVIAGGLELVLACDLVVAAEEATFSDGHARYGLFPAAGGATRLPRKVGENRAKELLFTAGTWSASRMHQAGVVNHLVPSADLRSVVVELTERIGRRSPLGIAGMKRVVTVGLDQPLEEALALELAECEKYTACADFAEGLRAFGERCEPLFAERRPENAY